MMTDTDRQILNFAGRRWQNAGAHNDAVVSELGLTPTRYWQRLNRLLDHPAALAEYPALIYRLRRITRRP